MWKLTKEYWKDMWVLLWSKTTVDDIIISKAAKIKAKAKPVITSEQFEKAKEYIKAGGSLNAIKSKYKLTATTENALLNEQKSSTKTTS